MKTKTTLHRLTGMLLSCIILVGMVPAAASADTEVAVSSWEALRGALRDNENKTVRLTEDISLELPKETDEGIVLDYYTVKITGGTKTLDLNGKKLYVSGGADTTSYLVETSLIQLSGNASLRITSTADEKGTLTYRNAKGNLGFDGKTSAVTMKDSSVLSVDNADVITWNGNTIALAEGTPNLTLGKGASITSMSSMAVAAYSGCTGGLIKLQDAAEIGRPGEVGDFHRASIALSGYGALKIYSGEVSLDIIDGALHGSVDVYSETQKNAFRATADKSIIINGTKRTDADFWTEQAKYGERGIYVTGQYLLTPDTSDIMSPSERVVVTPNIISKASVTVNTPVGGKKQDKTAGIPTVDEGKYTASVTGWYNGDGEVLADDEAFTVGRQYTVCVAVEANQGFSWADSFTANINGKNALVENTEKTNKKLIKYTFTATEGILENIYDAAVTVKEPAAYEVLVPQNHNAVSAKSDKYIVDMTSWYEGEDATGTSIPVNGTKAFETGKKYTISIRLLPADGKRFVSGTTVKVNDKDAVVTVVAPDGSVIYAKCTFTVVPPTLSPDIMTARFTVNEPEAGVTLLPEAHNVVSDEPYWYTADQTMWYEGTTAGGTQMPMNGTRTFEFGKKYTVYVKLIPVNDMKFVYGQTTVRINGKNADIQVQDKNGDVIYAQCTFDTLPGGIKMRFNPNGGTGTQELLYADEYGSVIMPECTFTKDGDSFHAWNVGGTLCYPGDPCNISQNTTATAVWSSELTKDVAVTMSTISEGNTPADIVFGSAESKFTVSAVWYRGDSVDTFERLSSTDRLSVDENYTVQLTINSADFLAAIDELNVTLNGKKMKNILSRRQKQVILNVQILNDVDVEFFEPMDGVPLATSVEMKPNSGRFFVSSALWFSTPKLKDKLDSGTVAKLGETYYLRLDLRSDAENQIFGGDTIKVNGKAYPVTDRGGFPTVDYIKSNPVFIATYPRVKISENADGSILVEASKDMKITFAAALYDSKGRMIEVLIKPDAEFSKGSKSITFFDILGNKSGKFLLGTSGYKVKFMAFENINNMTPIGNALIYKYRL